jgi:O-acetyl-ADP-ribose deacetylase (regulator of RNase III)
LQITTQYWTHPSITAIAGKLDPIHAITESARDLVFRAIEAGWVGPPFDPFQLANFAGIKVLPCEDVIDARIISASGDRFVIEFNPNRPRHRINYSICHEIAHTFFPDCSERVRNRAIHQEMSGDDWQLEMLCNMGAAELLMPIGSFPALDEQRLSIDQILTIRKKYEVSVEAVLLRTVNLTSEPCFVFSASVHGAGREKNYHIDYVKPSHSWDQRIPNGLLLPKATVAAECTAIGYTAKGAEQWLKTGDQFKVECVGLPPYPTQATPRVAGIGYSTNSVRTEPMQITILRGDATSPRAHGPKVIAQIVNDKALTWGAGFALAVRQKWPKVQEEYRRWATEGRANLKLGGIHVTKADPEIWIVSLVAQHGYGPSPTPRIRYGALEQSMAKLSLAAADHGATIHMPRLGAGQAGGSWSIIEEMINEQLCGAGLKVFVYDLPSAADKEAHQSLLF